MKNNPRPKDLIKVGAQFHYPSYWPRWEVINILSIQFNYKIGVEIGLNNGENMFNLLDKDNKKLKLYGVDPYKVQEENLLYEKNIDEKYRQRKWPFLFDVKEQKVVVPGLSKTDHYPRVHLNKKDNTQKFIYIHQIVGLTIPNEENKPIINHKNLDTFDYSVDNLEWATFSENATGSKRPSLDYDKVYDFFKIKEDLFKC